MYLVSTSIEIAASPETVRAKLLDFPQIPNYHQNGHFKSITPAIPNKLEPGDKMHTVLQGAAFDPVILQNTPTVFSWRGSLPGIFIGDHSFQFEPSKTTPGGTTFIQEERFTGLLSFMMGESYFANAIGFNQKTKTGFEGYNRDLKAWCERTQITQ